MHVETQRRPMPSEAERFEETVFNIQRPGGALRHASRPSSASTWTSTGTLVTAIIGPSGCGKSTFIRCLNRMNDLDPRLPASRAWSSTTARLYGPKVDPVAVRRRIGMVFQKPNPFPKSIYDNVAYGPRVLGMKDSLDERVEHALTQAALWDEVKDRLRPARLPPLRRPAATALHRARDRGRARGHPHGRAGSALDPIATARIEDLMHELKSEYTFVDRHAQHAAGRPRRRPDGVLHRPGGRGRAPHRQARRVRRDGEVFTAPTDKRTEDYVTGRFGRVARLRALSPLSRPSPDSARRSLRRARVRRPRCHQSRPARRLRPGGARPRGRPA